MDTQIEQLERLAALHRAGSLTDAEYEAQKARVLGERTAEAGSKPASGSMPDATLSTAWQRRFAFYRAYGWPFTGEGAAALRKMPFATARALSFNVWGFLFGPIYYYALGLWKRGTSLLGLAVVFSIVCQHLFGDTALRVVGVTEAALFACLVNYPYFIQVTEGRDDWNPLADYYPARASTPTPPAGTGL